MSNYQQQQWHPLNPAPRPIPVSRPNWFARHQFLSGLIGAALLAVIALQAPDPSVIAAGSAGANLSAKPVAPPAQVPASGPTRVAAPAPRQPAIPAPGATIGAPVRVGTFEFVVTQVERGVPEVGNEFHTVRAAGAFTLVHLRVTNRGATEQPLFDSNQKLVDSTGQMYATSPRAQLSLDGNDALLNDVWPQQTVSVVLAYDLPTRATPATIDLRGSLVSQASVAIALTRPAPSAP